MPSYDQKNQQNLEILSTFGEAGFHSLGKPGTIHGASVANRRRRDDNRLHRIGT